MVNFRLTIYNDSIKNTSVPLQNFFSSLSGSSIREFCKIERYIITGDFTTASSVLSALTPTNTVESNYIDYYNLYINYATHDFEHTTSGDQSSLESLASRCPGADGACVFQARALHNLVYKVAESWPVCSGSGSRIDNPDQSKIANRIHLFPNPTNDHVTISTNIESEILRIVIYDLTGRQVMEQTVQSKGFISKLDLNLFNGMYLMVLHDSFNEIVTHKLLIAK